MGYCSLLQGTFPTLGSSPRLLHLLHWQVDSLPLGPPENMGMPTNAINRGGIDRRNNYNCDKKAVHVTINSVKLLQTI